MKKDNRRQGLAIALLHYPVLDARGETVTTAVTNLDVHDLARSARTYGCTDYFLIHPIAAQRELVERIRAHWTEGSGGRRIPDRREALNRLRVVSSLEQALDALGGRNEVEVWATTARRSVGALSFEGARARLAGATRPTLVVFGTGWGLAQTVLQSADALLEPIALPHENYNHLSVRAACAVVLDRLLGAY